MKNHRFDDVPLDALSDADPIAQTRLPTADDPRARALLAEITSRPVGAADRNGPTRRWLPQPLWAAAAIAAVGIAVVGTVALLADRSPGEVESLPAPARSTDPAPTAAPSPSTAPSTVPTSEPSSTPDVASPDAALCAEAFSLDALAERTVVFDGTVESLDGNQATFVVERWFRGGEGAELTLTANRVTGGPVSSQDGPDLIEGERYLVAGFGEFVQACGFTQPYDPVVADAWAEVVAD